MKKISILALVVLICCTWIVFPGCNETDKENSDATEPEFALNIDAFSYEEAGTDIYGYVGKSPLYSHYLICTYRTIIDDFMEEQPDYDPDMTWEERIEYRDKLLLATDRETGRLNKEILQEKAINTAERMMAIYMTTAISENRKEAITDTWKEYGVEYYYGLKDLYKEVTTPDDAMRMVTGGNVKETAHYMQVHAGATSVSAHWFYDLEATNKDFEEYYNKHINDFRIVELRVIPFEDKASAEKVKSFMEQRPEDIENLAKAYNTNKKLAQLNGLVQVTSSCNMVPDSIKEWAYKQTEPSDKINIMETDNGWYLVICNNIYEYSDEEGNPVYTTVAEAYKRQKMEDRIDWIFTQTLYLKNNYDLEKAYDILENCI